MADNTQQDEEFSGFENLEDTYSNPAEQDNAGIAEDIDDAEFEDMNDDALDDVFEDDVQDMPAAKPKKKVNWFNIVVALGAVVIAGGLIAVKLAPQLLSGGTAMPEPQQMAAMNPNTATPQQAAQEAVAPAADTTGVPVAPGNGMLD
jgi:hypothetical protein